MKTRAPANSEHTSTAYKPRESTGGNSIPLKALRIVRKPFHRPTRKMKHAPLVLRRGRLLGLGSDLLCLREHKPRTDAVRAYDCLREDRARLGTLRAGFIDKSRADKRFHEPGSHRTGPCARGQNSRAAKMPKGLDVAPVAFRPPSRRRSSLHAEVLRVFIRLIWV